MRVASQGMAAMLMLCMVSPSLAAPPSPLKLAYEGKRWVLQYNLHFSDDETGCVNFITEGDYLPVGTTVVVKTVKAERVVFVVGENARSRLTLDLSDCLGQSAEVLKRLLGTAVPSEDGLNDVDRTGVKSSTAQVGMSRAGVFRAIGYPPWHYSPPFFGDKKSATNHDLDADELIYMGSTWDFVTVRFNAGVVVAVED